MGGLLAPSRAMVMPRPGLLLRPLPGFVVLLQSQSVFTSMAPATTAGRENRATQNWPSPTGCNTRENWPCPSPGAALWKEGPAPLLGSTIELTLMRGQGQDYPQDVRVGELALTSLPAIWWHR